MALRELTSATNPAEVWYTARKRHHFINLGGDSFAKGLEVEKRPRCNPVQPLLVIRHAGAMLGDYSHRSV